MSTREVLEHHLDTFGSLDLEGVMEDYDEDSVVLSHMGEFRGLDEIRGMFEGFFDEFDDPDARFDVREEIVDGDVAYITWDAESPDNVYEFGTDTFLIEGGVIRYQTVGASVTPKD